MKKFLKSVLVSILLVCLVTSSIPICMAAETDLKIKSVVVNDIEIVQGTSGWYEYGYSEVLDEWDLQYYYYIINPYVTVITEDGTEYSGYDGFYCEETEDWYYLDYNTGQSYDNQWGLGSHTVSASLLGYEVSFDVNIIECPVEKVEFGEIELVENYDGGFTTDYDWETDESYEWFCYDYQYDIEMKVYIKDGTVLEGEFGNSVYYNGTEYTLEYNDDQAYDNQWGLGSHKISANIMGFETSFDVNVVESPVKSIEVEDVTLIEKADGSYTGDYDWFTGEYDCEWFEYYYEPLVTVTFKDGTQYSGDGGFLDDEDNWYDLKIYDDQSYENQWSVGKHTVKASILGCEDEITVTVVETPVKSVQIEDVEVYENIDGDYVNAYNSETGEWDLEWYKYYYSKPEFTVTLKDGSVLKGSYSVEYNDEYYYVETSDDQSYNNQWKKGTHTAEINILGYETTFNVNVLESPYQSIEVVEVKPLLEGDVKHDYFSGEEQFYYNIPDFRYRITKKDGTTAEGKYSSSSYSNEVTVEHNQFTQPWTVDGTNTFTVEYKGMTAEGNAIITPSSDFEYIKQNGGLYITNCRSLDETIEIPSEIDNVPVVGIMSLGKALYSAKNITIPDSVTSLGNDIFNSYDNAVTNLTIGKGVNFLDADMFINCKNLESINVSSDNSTYSSVDGVVYNKSKDTLVVYPLGKGDDYKVPASVTNIDVLDLYQYASINVTFDDASKSYVTVDGVTYTADMKKIIRCNTDKEGSYTMPDSVTKISDMAFSGCSKLESVDVSDNVTEIAYGAFLGCTSLSEVDMPETVKKIESYAFINCSSLENVNLSDSLEEIDYRSFDSSGLTEIDIPDKVTTIENYAFSNTAAATITIGNNVRTIGEGAFAGTPVKSIVIPDSVETLGEYAFGYCENLAEIKIGKGLKEIPARAFAVTDIKEITIPANIEKIGSSAFASCSKLDNVIFENPSVEIGSYAFSGCPLRDTELPGQIKTIQVYTFASSQMTEVTVPQSVTEIAYGAFSGSSDLGEIDVPESAITIGGHTFDNTKWYNSQSDGEVYLEHIFYDYKGEMPENTKLEIKSGTTTIADYALENCSGMTTAVLPEGIKRIGVLAFDNCENLTEVNIPASVSDIGDYAFVRCPSLEKINVDPNNKYYTSIDGVLFNKNCTELIWCPKRSSSEYVVPDSVKRIRAFAFEQSAVESVVINSANITLDEYSLGYKFVDYASLSKEVEAKYSGITVECYENSPAAKYAEDNLLNRVVKENNAKPGDIDSDNIVDVKDVTALQMNLAGYDNKVNTAALDINKDNKVDVVDVTTLQMKLAGYKLDL